MAKTSTLVPWLPWLLILSSCSSPPKPPTVDESRKRPANSAMAVELQACRSDLHNSLILAGESARNAEASTGAVARIAQQQQELARALEAGRVAQRNLVLSVPFAFGSSEVSITEADSAMIAREARNAPLVVLRGRTDGTNESVAESRIARQRAATVEAVLVRAGIDRARIRTTWQPVGDHAADNTTPGGRSLNRRVEIEIYRSAPIVTTAGALDATLLAQRGAAPE